MDGVNMFLDHFKISEEDFIDYGIKNIIYSDPGMAHASFKTLQRIIKEHKGEICIRNFGRIPTRQEEFLRFCKETLEIPLIVWDDTNNKEPGRFFQSTTSISKKQITNYKLSHIWGKTKNPYAFCAAWNLCYTPLFIDPFTGHEAKGLLSANFSKAYRNHAFDLFKESIEEFNDLMLSLKPKITSYLIDLQSNQRLTDKDKAEIAKAIANNFSIIEKEV